MSIPSTLLAGDVFDVSLTLPNVARTADVTGVLATGYGRATFSLALTDGVWRASVPGTTTSQWEPGVHRLFVFAAQGDGRRKVFESQIKIERDPEAVGANIESLSHAQKMVDALEHVLLGKTCADVQSYSIAQRMATRYRWDELQTMLDRYREAVRREQGTSVIGRKIIVQL